MAEEQQKSFPGQQDVVSEAGRQDTADLTFEEVMTRLSLSRAQLYRRIKEGTLKATKTDAALRFLERDVLAAESVQADQQQTVADWLHTLAEQLAQAGVANLSAPPGPEFAAAMAEMGHRLVLVGTVGLASDIYVTPTTQEDRILMRRNGRIHEAGRLDRVLGNGLKAQLKALASWPAANTSPSQDVVVEHSHDKWSTQIYLTAVSTTVGEQIHLHFLPGGESQTFEAIGYSPQQATLLPNLLMRRPGLIVLGCGPGRAADSQRLAFAHCLHSLGFFVIALDRRLHYQSEHIVPLRLTGPDGPGFADQWQTALQLHPDVIMLDTVSDCAETQHLPVAIAAGITVIIQVPSADGITALEYLVDLGLDPKFLDHHLLVASENRSLPLLCSTCRVPRPCTEAETKLFDIPASSQLYEGSGCDRCDKGYCGYRTVFGLLTEEEIRSTAAGHAVSTHPYSLSKTLQTALLAGDVSPEHCPPLGRGTAQGLRKPIQHVAGECNA